MKNISLLLVLSVLFNVNGSFAQTLSERQEIIANCDLEKLSQLQTEYSEQFNNDREEALELAAIYGWEVIIEMPNGGTAALVGIHENGKPKYIVTHNREGGITTRANKVHSGGGAGLDLNGENMIVGEWDGGSVRGTHPLLEERVTQMDTPSSFTDHATHVAGTMIGTGDVQSGAAKGMAPLAELEAYDFFSDSGEMAGAAANGLLVSNHSYGVGIENLDRWELGYYDNLARGFDNIAYNAPYYTIVCSAGNDRQSGANNNGGYDYLTDRSTAKNNIVVAATNEVLIYTSPSSVVMSSFSSWGPTDDGRVKPDISAKGVDMFSSVSFSSYTNLSGTSMASPNVAGSILLLQQHYNDIYGEYMLSSTLRGLALHTADEAGTTPGPDFRFGWGLLNIEKAAETITNNGTSSVIVEEELQSGEVYTFTVQSNGIDDLAVSVTWTDPAGFLLPAGVEDDPTPSLINDLDLRVSQDGGATFYPWKLDPANFGGAATQEDNFVDNIEKTEIIGASGEYIIQVSHKGKFLTNDSQVFSLIVTGIDKEEFTVSSHEGVKNTCASDGSVTFGIDLGFSDGFSDTIDFSVSNLPAGTTGLITPISLNTEGTVALTVNGISSLAEGDYPIKVTAIGSSETVNLYVILHILGENTPSVGLIYPEDNAIDLPIAFIFKWELGDNTIDNYDFELSRFSNFSNLEFSENVEVPQVFIGGVTEGAEYFWRVRSNNICFNGEYSEVYSFTVEGVLGLNDFEIEGLVAYPNPTNSILNLKAASVISNVEVFDVLGQKLYTETMNTNKTQIDLSAFQAGNYLVRVTTDNFSKVLQIVKQ